jgi:hypothetical protein
VCCPFGWDSDFLKQYWKQKAGQRRRQRLQANPDQPAAWNLFRVIISIMLWKGEPPKFEQKKVTETTEQGQRHEP